MTEGLQNSGEVVGSWNEPSRASMPQIQFSTPIIVAGSAILAAGFIAAGYFLKDWTYYLAAVAAIVAGAYFIIQKKKPLQGFTVTLTETFLTVGNKSYDLSGIAGFWFSWDNGMLAINVEPAKAALFPITFLYKNDNPEEARNLLLQVMNEVEPRR